MVSCRLVIPKANISSATAETVSLPNRIQQPPARWFFVVRYALVVVLVCGFALPTATADIFEWEWIDPSNHALGRQESTTLVPDGAGLVPLPGMNANYKDLTQAYLIGSDLSSSNFYLTILNNADLSGANLTDIFLRSSTLINANLSGANLTEAFLHIATLTNADLRGANLTDAYIGDATLTDADLRGANLTDAFIGGATLTNTDFTNSEVHGTSFHSTPDFTSAQLYTTASYQAGDLTGIDLSDNNLTGWYFNGQNLIGADFESATLTNTDFTNAEVRGTSAEMRGTNLQSTTDSGFTATQLYSTASYQARDLSAISLGYNDLAGWNFAGQNLTYANFRESILTNADLRGANLTNVSLLDASLQNADLRGANLTNVFLLDATLMNADLRGANLTDTYFGGVTLTNADFTNSEVRRAKFGSTTDSGFTSAQLYSTASYQAGDLTGIGLNSNNLTEWNFAGQNLTNVSFDHSTLTNADLTNAEVRGANFRSTTIFGFTSAQLYSTASYQAGDLKGINLGSNNLLGWNFVGQNLTDAWLSRTRLTNSDFSGADVRGAVAFNTYSNLIISDNLIHADGHVEGLQVAGGDVMRLWDYDGPTLIPILVEDAMSIDPAGTLRAVFEDSVWGSTVTFEGGIGVTLDGTLELLVDPDEETNLTSLIGTTFDLFDWTGVSPSGTFAQITTLPGLVWDTSNLYTTGDVMLIDVSSALFADFDDDGDADGSDFLAWQRGFGTASGATGADGDADGDGDVDADDLKRWKERYGTQIVAAAGDLDGNGDFDGKDFLKWQRAFGSVYDAADLADWKAGYGGGLAASSTAVPEPSGAVLLLTAFVVGCLRSRRGCR